MCDDVARERSPDWMLEKLNLGSTEEEEGEGDVHKPEVQASTDDEGSSEDECEPAKYVHCLDTGTACTTKPPLAVPGDAVGLASNIEQSTTTTKYMTSRETKHMTSKLLSQSTSLLRPDHSLTGLQHIDVPQLRLTGPCARACCDPNAADEWKMKEKPPPRLFPPLMPAMEPTVAFGASNEFFESAGLQPCFRPKLYVKYGGVQNNAVKAAFKMAGFRIIKGDKNYNALWSGAMKAEEFKTLNRYQRVNHFPGTWELGRKDRLGRNIARMRRRHPEVFNIQPRSFALPQDADDWRLECERYPDGMYILKPPASSRGRGIRMMRRPSDVKPEKDLLIQRYVRDPHLIDGFKYDMRVYVAVTSIDPLRVYVYREGLVRFATEKYSQDPDSLKRRCMHLTNYSVNSKKEGFTMALAHRGQYRSKPFSANRTRPSHQTSNGGEPFQPCWVCSI